MAKPKWQNQNGKTKMAKLKIAMPLLVLKILQNPTHNIYKYLPRFRVVDRTESARSHCGQDYIQIDRNNWVIVHE